MEIGIHISRLELLNTAEGSARIRLTGVNGEACVLEMKPGAAVDIVAPEDLGESGGGGGGNPEGMPEGMLKEMEDLLSRSLSEEMGIPKAAAGAADPEPPPKPRSNRVLEELEAMEPDLGRSRCPECGREERLAITREGVVVLCRGCGRIQRIDSRILQRLADRLQAACFSCGAQNLQSEELPHASLLKCRNPQCGVHNSWQGLRDRLDAGRHPE